MPAAATPRPYPKTIDERLKVAASHLGYEWAMRVGGRHADWHKQPAADRQVNLAGQHASTEVVLLHARLLFEFLTKDRGHRDKHGRHLIGARDVDNVRAIDLLDPGTGGLPGPMEEWESRRKAVCPYLRGEMERLNQRLSHLSYAREVQDEGWDKVRIIREMREALRTWLALLPQERRARLRAAMDRVATGVDSFWD